MSNPNSYLRKVYSPRTQEPDESLSTMPTQHHPTSAVGVVNLNDTGPCEVCGKLVPIETLVRHEVRTVNIVSIYISVRESDLCQHLQLFV